MTENEIKATSEEMVIKVIEYLRSACKSDKEFDERCLELATSLVTTTVDFDKSVIEIIGVLSDKCHNIRDIAIGGSLRYKAGDETNVKRIYRD